MTTQQINCNWHCLVTHFIAFSPSDSPVINRKVSSKLLPSRMIHRHWMRALNAQTCTFLLLLVFIVHNITNWISENRKRTNTTLERHGAVSLFICKYRLFPFEKLAPWKESGISPEATRPVYRISLEWRGNFSAQCSYWIMRRNTSVYLSWRL